MAALVRLRWGEAGDGNVNFEENIVGIFNMHLYGNDVGGEDRDPCFLARPRGCVGRVVWRARTYFALMLVG